MIKTLIVTSLSSLSLLLPAPHTGKAGNSDPIIHSQVFTKTQTLHESRLQPVSALELVYLNKLRPYGTYGGGGYQEGQCTFGAATRLPVPSGWGNANQWAYSAILAGYTVSNIPKEGTVAQTTGDSWAGHVATVLSVNPDGSFLIWEENGAGGPFTTDERTTTTAEFQSFIYF